MDWIKYLLIYLLAINILAFIVCWRDKRKAEKGKWRVRESTLFLLAAIGGSVGLLAGMYVVRHKTRHLRFTVGIPLILAVQVSAVVYYFILK